MTLPLLDLSYQYSVIILRTLLHKLIDIRARALSAHVHYSRSNDVCRDVHICSRNRGHSGAHCYHRA